MFKLAVLALLAHVCAGQGEVVYVDGMRVNPAEFDSKDVHDVDDHCPDESLQLAGHDHTLLASTGKGKTAVSVNSFFPQGVSETCSGIGDGYGYQCFGSTGKAGQCPKTMSGSSSTQQQLFEFDGQRPDYSFDKMFCEVYHEDKLHVVCLKVNSYLLKSGAVVPVSDTAPQVIGSSELVGINMEAGCGQPEGTISGGLYDGSSYFTDVTGAKCPISSEPFGFSSVILKAGDGADVITYKAPEGYTGAPYSTNTLDNQMYKVSADSKGQTPGISHMRLCMVPTC